MNSLAEHGTKHTGGLGASAMSRRMSLHYFPFILEPPYRFVFDILLLSLLIFDSVI
jgi:hypothetical protein